jgi:hypothetical protein
MKTFITTSSGIHINPLDPDPSKINIVDIVHALSNICRYGGHCTPFYSVAEHECRLYEIVPPAYANVALMHDSAEAYLLDIPSLVKAELPGYIEAEDRLLRLIFEKYGIDYDELHSFTEYEDILLATEVRDLHINSEGWDITHVPLVHHIYPLSPPYAEKLLMRLMAEACIVDPR